MRNLRDTTNISTLSLALNKLLTTRQLAELLDAILCCEEEERLTDREVAAAQWLFDDLTELCPEAVEIAAQGIDR